MGPLCEPPMPVPIGIFITKPASLPITLEQSAKTTICDLPAPPPESLLASKALSEKPPMAASPLLLFQVECPPHNAVNRSPLPTPPQDTLARQAEAVLAEQSSKPPTAGHLGPVSTRLPLQRLMR